MHAAPPANGPGRHASGASPVRPRSLWRVYLFELVAVLSLAAVTAFSILAPVGLHYSLLARLTFRRMALIAVVSVACILVTKLLSDSGYDCGLSAARCHVGCSPSVSA